MENSQHHDPIDINSILRNLMQVLEEMSSRTFLKKKKIKTDPKRIRKPKYLCNF